MILASPEWLDVVIVAAGSAVTLVIVAALLYWIDQEWRDRDRRERAHTQDSTTALDSLDRRR